MNICKIVMGELLMSSCEYQYPIEQNENSLSASKWKKKGVEQGIKNHLVPQDGSSHKHNSQLKSPLTPTTADFTPDIINSADLSRCFTSDIDTSFSSLQNSEEKKLKYNKISSRKTSTPARHFDRFIPNRTTTNTEIGHYKLTINGKEVTNNDQTDYQKTLESTLLSGKLLRNYSVLSFTRRPTIEEELIKKQKHQEILQLKSKPIRYIPTVPEKILDAPDLLDDFYLTLMDWSSNGNLAIALYNTLYIWNYIEDRAWMLFHLDSVTDYISSVSWIEEGYVIAIGISSGNIQLWDVVEEKLLRTMIGHIGRIPSLSWNAYILSSGSQTGYIHHHDVRVPNQFIFSISAHEEEVCGLTWSPNGQYLASGGNDNQLHIWSSINQNIPTYTSSDHLSAVKAMKWCPWQHNILATGGGIDDQIIRIWNTNIRSCIQNVATNSQICDLLWIENHRELISAHGDPSNHLMVWKYPNLKKTVELKGHTNRVLSLAVSPEGNMVASAAADETIRLWNGFGINKNKKQRNATTIYNSNIFSISIR